MGSEAVPLRLGVLLPPEGYIFVVEIDCDRECELGGDDGPANLPCSRQEVFCSSSSGGLEAEGL